MLMLGTIFMILHWTMPGNSITSYSSEHFREKYNPITPFEIFHKEISLLEKLKILFCSFVVNVGEKSDDKDLNIVKLSARHKQNSPKRSIRGVHIALTGAVKNGYMIHPLHQLHPQCQQCDVR